MSNFIISFPKSGRTWLKAILGCLVCHREGQNFKYIFDKNKLLMWENNFPFFTHDDVDKNISIKKIFKNKQKHFNDKIVFLWREPKDVMVSYYFHRKFRKSQYNGNISSFIKDPIWGIDRWIAFNEMWSDDLPLNFLLIKYEDLHHSINVKIRDIIDFFCMGEITDDMIQKAIEFCSFENMQKMERKNIYKKKLLMPTKKNDLKTYKVRSGKVNDFINHISENDISFIDEKIKRAKILWMD